MYLKIALFVQIIVTNCMILGRAEAFASRTSVGRSILDALGTAFGFAIALLTLGLVRELIGRGTIGANLDLLFGPIASDWGWEITTPLLSLANYPPGAFLLSGLLLAAGVALAGRKQSK